MDLLIATRNAGKQWEYRALLGGIEGVIHFPDELGLTINVKEDGTTYAANARKKARSYAAASGLLTIADDSGLEVDALGGAPGVRSARYAEGSDADRVAALLEDLRGVPWEQRAARFRCVLVAATHTEELFETEGVCEGMIACEPQGQGGFGYDPVFYLPDRGCTMAQLPPENKNRISHRARAVESARPILERILQKG